MEETIAIVDCLYMEEINIAKLSTAQSNTLSIPLNPLIRYNGANKPKNTTRKNNQKTPKIPKTPKAQPYINMIVDSGATRHCSNHINHMTNIRNTNVIIMVGNGDILKSTKMGDIGILKDILYIPEIKHFLFSLSYFLNTTKNYGIPDKSITFEKDYCEILHKRNIIARGILNENNLYVMRLLLESTPGTKTEKQKKENALVAVSTRKSTKNDRIVSKTEYEYM